MNESARILIVGREQEIVDEVAHLLEGAGCIVTTTLNDGNAIDLAGTSDYAALVIEGEVSQSDMQYMATAVRTTNPTIAVIVVYGPESVLTQLRQAGVEV